MKLTNLFKDRYNLTILALVAIFFLIPFLEKNLFIIPVTSLIFPPVLILSFRILALPSKHFWYLILLTILAFCLDLLVIFILNPVLEVLLTIVIHWIYAFCFIVCLWVLIKGLYAPDANPKSLLKAGVCGYFLIGLLWTVLYSFAYILSPRAFLDVRAEIVRFFYLSFSSLSLLTSGESLEVFGSWIKCLATLEAMAGQIFLVLLIIRLVVLFKSYEGRG